MTWDSLNAWLDVACRDLYPQARERVRRDYLSAYADAREAGETEILAAWGDPRRVNRELRRTFLTVQDMQLLQPLQPARTGAAPLKSPPTPQHLPLWMFLASLPGMVLVLQTIFHLSWPAALLATVLFQGPMFLLFWTYERWTQGSAARSVPERQLGEVAWGCVLLAYILAFLSLVPWPVPLDLGARGLMWTLGGFLCVLGADLRRLERKAAFTFRAASGEPLG